MRRIRDGKTILSMQFSGNVLPFPGNIQPDAFQFNEANVCGKRVKGLSPPAIAAIGFQSRQKNNNPARFHNGIPTAILFERLGRKQNQPALIECQRCKQARINRSTGRNDCFNPAKIIVNGPAAHSLLAPGNKRIVSAFSAYAANQFAVMCPTHILIDKEQDAMIGDSLPGTDKDGIFTEKITAQAVFPIDGVSGGQQAQHQ